MAVPARQARWRSPPRRDVGGIGLLNLKAGGPGVLPELPAELQKTTPGWKPSADVNERNRRSIYVFVKRNLRYPLFALFDATDRNETCAGDSLPPRLRKHSPC